MENIDRVILQSICHTKNKHDIVCEYMWFVVTPGEFHSRSVAGDLTLARRGCVARLIIIDVRTINEQEVS